jgi:beta-glucanase (GH16 family)
MFLNPMKLLKPKIGLVFAALLLSSAAEAAPPGEGWALGWSDEFDGTALNGSNWTVGTGNRRDAVNTANALSVQDGYLRIKTYTEGGTHYTGWIGSQGKYENCFGYWEARVRYRSSQGMWSAFWLQPYGINSIGDPAGNGTEIDIAEHRSRDSGGANLTNSLAMNVHWDGYGASHQSVGSTVGNPGANPASLQGNFHTYGLLWEPGRYRFYIDGVEVWTTTAAISQVRQWIYLTSEVDNGAWAGPTPGSYGDRSSTSTYQDIDYVRFYQRAEQTVNGAFSNRMGPWRQIGTASLAATGGRNGGAGARMNPSNTSGGRVAQKVAGLLPNTPYVVRGWGNVGSRTWPDVRIGARDYGGAETFASIWSNGFTAAEKVFVTGASNSTADVFAWVPTQYGDCHADDIEIRRAGRFTNGGFESGDGSHWAPYGDTLVQSWGGAFRRSGTSALRLNANAAARGAEHAVYGLKPATAYTLSAWAKGNGQPVRLGVKNHGGADAFSTVTGAGGNWTRGSHSFTTGATHTSATLYAYAAAGSSVAAVDLDDFLLLEALPPTWTSTKIGPGHPGEAGLSDGRVIVRGSGNNLGTASDGLQFVHQPMAGDGKVTAKLNSFEAAHNRAKAGLMMRASTAVDAPFAMVHWMTEGQCEFIWRNSAGTAASYVWAAGTTAWPPQLRLVRSGNLVTASFSTNGSTWTQIGATQAIDLPANLLAGLAVSSHEPDDSGEAVFSNFSFTGDRDGDGLPDDDETNTGTYVSPTNTGTDPDVPDTDGDGFPDGAEVLNGTNPLVPNTELIWQPGAAPGGSGNWDSLASTWRVGSGPTAWIPGKTALFGGTAGTVGIGSGIAGIGGLVFNTSGYVLDGSGPLVLAPEAGIALNAASTSILTPLSGSSTLNITGGVAGSQLQLRGNSSGFSGALVIDGNAQIRAYNTATGSATGSELGGPESTAEIRAGSQLRWFNLAGSPTYPLNFHLSGGGIAGGNAGALNHDSSTARTITLSGAITLDAPATIGTQNNGSWVINGPLSGEHALTMLLGAANSSINGPTDLAALVKSGGATLVLGGDDLRIGSTTVAGGVVQVGNGATSGTLDGNVTVNAGSTLAFSRSDTTTFAGSISGMGTVSKTGTGTLVLAGSNSFGAAGSTYLFGNLGVTSLGTLRLAHPQALGNHSKIRLNQWQGGVSTLELSGGLSFPLGVETAGRNTAAGQVFLRNVSGANTLTGGVAIVEAGGFYFVDALAGSSLTIGGSFTTTPNGLAARDVRFRGDGDITLSGNLSDSATATPTRLNVTKEGAGTLVLGGSTTLLNPIVLNGGTLTVNGTITQAAVVAAAGTRLGGSGSLAGATVAGVLAPGNGTGTLAASGAVGVSGTLEMEINGAAADRLNVTGLLTLSGSTLDLKVLAGGVTQPSYVLANYGSRSGSPATVLGLPFGYSLDFQATQLRLVRNSSLFAIWAHGEGLGGNASLATADPDQDGMENALEFLLRGDPETADLSILPAGEKSGGNFIFTFTRDKAAQAETGAIIEHAPDPASPTWTGATAGMIQLADHGDTETVTVTIPASTDRLFVRLRVP